jgi:hypothetical protein
VPLTSNENLLCALSDLGGCVINSDAVIAAVRGSEQGSLGYLNLYRQFDADALLFDVNYLTTVFQPALARAAERIFDDAAESSPRHLAATAG